MTKERVTLTLLALLFVGGLLSLINSLATHYDLQLLVVNLAELVCVLALMLLYRRGWRWTGAITVALVTVLVIASSNPDFFRDNTSQTIYVPSIVAAILLAPYWALVVFVATISGIAANILIQTGAISNLGPTYSSTSLLLQSVIVSGITIASMVARTATRTAQGHAEKAERASQELAQSAQELQEANNLLSQQLDQQKELLELVTTLETPIVTLSDGILFAPLVGNVDTRRADEAMRRLLEAVVTQQSRYVILDVAGVAILDTAVTRALVNMVQALRLLGCQVAISGISAKVAIAMTQLGVRMEDVRTVRSPQEALAAFAEKEMLLTKVAGQN